MQRFAIPLCTRRAFSTLARSSLHASRAATWLPAMCRRAPTASTSLLTATPSLSSSSLFVRTLFIQTQSTPNPNSLRFIPGKPVSPTQSYDFNSYRSAATVSPLAATLFAIDGVSSVYLGTDSLSINIKDGADWSIIKPEVFAAIMDHYASGKPVVNPPSSTDGSTATDATPISSTTILPTDSEVVALIKELIETRIRPAVQEDGGDIDFKSFDEASGKVYVQMQGSCKGCSSSAITLKNGIENMLMHYVPEVKGVEEYVDEVLESVSDEQLRKLEEKLERAKAPSDASPA